MQELILTISITIQIPKPSMQDGADKLKPGLTKEQPPVCRCHVRYETKAA